MIYFDNSATSKFKPKCMIDSMTNCLLDSANPGRASHNDSIDIANEIFETRELIKNVLSAPTKYQVIFTKNTTEALNTAILGYIMSLKGKVHVITSMLEHNSVLRPLKHLANIGKIDVTILPLKDNVVSPIDVEQNIRRNTSLIALNHTSNVLGSTIDIDSISKIASSYNIPLLVDTAQSLGHRRISLKDTNISLLAGAGHKGLHGPQGVGFLVVDTSRIKLQPLMYGGTGTNSDKLDMPIEYPEAFEVGTLNAPNIIGLKSSIKWTYDNFDTINNCINKYSKLIYTYLSSNKDIELYSPKDSQVLSFNVKGYTSSEISDYLNTQNIATRSGLHCAPLVHSYIGTTNRGMVRISPGYNNTIADIDLLTLAIDKIPRSN